MATANVPNTTPRAIMPSRLTLAVLDGSDEVDSLTLQSDKDKQISLKSETRIYPMLI